MRERRFIDFKMFWDRGGGVPLVYEVANENTDCNRKEAKEMKRNKEKCKSDTGKM